MGMSVSRLLMRSMLDRWFSLGLIVFSMALAVGLFLSVQNVQKMTRANFESSVANVDLVVAARGSEIQILLNSVFGVGQSAALVSAESMEKVSRFADVPGWCHCRLATAIEGFASLAQIINYLNMPCPARPMGICALAMFLMRLSARMWPVRSAIKLATP